MEYCRNMDLLLANKQNNLHLLVRTELIIHDTSCITPLSFGENTRQPIFVFWEKLEVKVVYAVEGPCHCILDMSLES